MEMTHQDISFCENWCKTRVYKLKFILIRGILQFALPFTLIMTFFELIDRRFYFDKDLAKVFLTLLMLSIIVGIISAIITFKLRDRKYLQFKKNEKFPF